jgi:hypothetical protein
MMVDDETKENRPDADQTATPARIDESDPPGRRVQLRIAYENGDGSVGCRDADFLIEAGQLEAFKGAISAAILRFTEGYFKLLRDRLGGVVSEQVVADSVPPGAGRSAARVASGVAAPTQEPHSDGR